MRLLKYAALAAALVVLAAAPSAASGEKAKAALKAADGKELGTVTLVETTAGVLLTVKLAGLPPGPHGFHIHEAGKCESDFASAGATYNPLGAKHGLFNEDGPMAGNLPNLIVPANGEVEVELLSTFITLSKDAEESLFDEDGSAVVVFERPDDHISEPEGNAGARIACGAIVAE